MWRKIAADKKKIIYMICFLWLVIGDFIRGSQDGDKWAMSVNSIGFVMTVIILSHFSWKNENKKTYLMWSGIWLAGAALCYGVWYLNPSGVYRGQYITGALNVWCMGIIALKLWSERKRLLLKKERLSLLVVLWVLMSVLMLFSPYGSIWQIWFLFLFGAFYITPFTKEEYKSLWDGMANGIIFGFFCLQIYAYGFRPYDEVRYKGAFGNCNINALFYLVTYLMFLYRIHDYTLKSSQRKAQEKPITWSSRLEIVFYYVMAGGLLSFVLFTQTRTALLMGAVVTVLYGVLTVVIVYKEKLGRLLLFYILIGFCAIATFPAVYLTIRYLPTVLHRPVWYGGEYSVNKVHSFDEPDSWKYISLDEFLESAFGRLNYGGLLTGGLDETEEIQSDQNHDEQPESQSGEEIQSGEESQSGEKIQSGEEIQSEVSGPEEDNLPELLPDIDEPSVQPADTDNNTQQPQDTQYILGAEDASDSGKIRMEIYRLYFKNLNLRGHKLTDGFYQITEEYHAWHAQNVFLQMAYFYGIPAGLLNIVILMVIGFRSVSLVWKRRQSVEILPFLVWMLFVGYGMLECVWNPGQMILFLLFFVQKIFLMEKKA